VLQLTRVACSRLSGHIHPAIQACLFHTTTVMN